MVLEVLPFIFNLNKTQNVKTEIFRKQFNENGIGIFLSKNSKQYHGSTLSQGGRCLTRV